MNSQRKAWVAFLIVFALGGVTGASLDGIYRLRASAVSPAAPVSIRDTDAYFETLKRELTLNDNQSSAMRAILDRTRDATRRFAPMSPALRPGSGAGARSDARIADRGSAAPL
jgi:hypothetical protein